MNNVGQLFEYGIRAIQTYTISEGSQSGTIMTDQLTKMTNHQYRIPYLVYVKGTVKTQSGTGVENITVSYCHIDRNKGQRDTNLVYCPIASFGK